jgi:ABC transport system ATP-binding/permease protein
VLDEPTNDLDIETLEVLEDLLMDYSGTLLLVSHDRAFLNNLVTSTLALDESGLVKEYIGGYDDWRQEQAAQARAAEKRQQIGRANPRRGICVSNRKPSYKEQRALSKPRNANWPSCRAASKPWRPNSTCSQPAWQMRAFYQREASQISRTMNRLKDLEDELASGLPTLGRT